MTRALLALALLASCGPRYQVYDSSHGCMSVAPRVVQCAPTATMDDYYCVSFRLRAGWRVICSDQSRRM